MVKIRLPAVPPHTHTHRLGEISGLGAQWRGLRCYGLTDVADALVVLRATDPTGQGQSTVSTGHVHCTGALGENAPHDFVCPEHGATRTTNQKPDAAAHSHLCAARQINQPEPERCGTSREHAPSSCSRRYHHQRPPSVARSVGPTSMVQPHAPGRLLQQQLPAAPGWRDGCAGATAAPVAGRGRQNPPEVRRCARLRVWAV